MVPHSRLRAGLYAASIILVWSGIGRGAPPRAADTCAQTLERARDHAEAGRLRRARAAYAECVQSTCGRVAVDCRGAEQRLADSVPSIVPFVTDGQRAQPTDVAVSMDGEVLTTRIDGRSVEVDPGLHEIVFSMAGREIYRESILILEGQRNRLITVNLSDQATPPPLTATPQAPELAVPATSPEAAETTTTTGRDSAPSASVVPFVVGGVGVAAIGGSLLMAHWASDDNRELDLCAPNCSQESVDHVRNMYIAADITLGAGVVALGAATWLYFSSADRERPNDTAAYHVDVHPVARGAMATMAAEF